MNRHILIFVLILFGCGGSTGGGSGGDRFDIKMNNCIASGDLNGDELTDIVIGDSDSYIFVCIQESVNPGNFIKNRRRVNHTPNAIKIVDLNADGKLDIITISDSVISVFLQDPLVLGTFPTETVYKIPSRPETIRGNVDVVSVGDLNSDEKIDIAVPVADGICIFFQDPSNAGSFLPSATIIQNTGITSLAIEDLNGDGLDDIAVGQTDQSKISIYIQNSILKGSFILDNEYSYSKPWYIYIGDLNGDNEADIIIANSNSIGIFFQNIDQPGDFSETKKYTLDGNLDRIAIADLNNDGLNDIASINYDKDSMIVFIQDISSSGSFLQPNMYDMSSPWDMTVGNLNNDGKLDIAIVSSDKAVIYFQDPNNPGKYLKARNL